MKAIRDRLFADKTEYIRIENQKQLQQKNSWIERLNLFRIRLPYSIQHRLGINMQFYIIRMVPDNLQTIPIREALKNDNLDEIKNLIFKGHNRLDDPIDIFSCHTLLHDAVMLEKVPIFDFLVSQKANLNLRD